MGLVRRALQPFSFFWLCLGYRLLTAHASGQLIQIDAYADMRFVVASDSVTVFSKRVSGAPDELLALNATNGALLWRERAESVRSGGTTEPDGSLYVVAKNQLQKRRLSSGKLLWQLPLDKIPEQKPAPRFNFQSVKEKALALARQGMGTPAALPLPGACTPNWYDFQPPAVADGKLLIFREAMESTGCLVSTCFSDWLLIDAATGKFTTGGAGRFIGQAGRTWLMSDDGGLWQFHAGRVSVVTGPDVSGPAFGWISRFSGSQVEEFSSGERCLFEARGSNGGAIGIFDATQAKVTSFPDPATRTNEQSSWVLMGTNVLRYAQCERLWGNNGVRPKGHPWFELYTLDGRLLRSAEIKFAAPRDDYRVRYAGRREAGILFELDETPYQVAVPGLQITRLAAREAAHPDRTSSESVARGDVTYHIAGNITVQHLEEFKPVHDLVVTCAETTSPRKLWQHVERVKMQKIKAE